MRKTAIYAWSVATLPWLLQACSASDELDPGFTSLDSSTSEVLAEAAPEAGPEGSVPEAAAEAPTKDTVSSEPLVEAESESNPPLDSSLEGDSPSTDPTPLRYLSINVGNASPQYGCWEYKLCREQDVEHLRDYLATWKPDIVLLTEVYQKEQLSGTAMHGPILPQGYEGRCGESLDRETGQPAAYNADNASHEHECIAWKTSRLTYVAGSALSSLGRNDAYGKSNCGYDFTGFRVQLTLQDGRLLTPVIAHPDAKNSDCRVEEITRIWALLAQGERVLIGGDWNTDSEAELQRPSTFRVNYSLGWHWDLVQHSGEYTATYVGGLYGRNLDHAFSNVGEPCVACHAQFAQAGLAFASVVGGYDEHPRADQGEGFDHRQLLIDLLLP